MDQYKVDFHIHTCYSDGQATPTAIVKNAKELDYDIIAITDHDGVDGVKEALIAGEAVGLKVVPGIELATETEEGIGLHILGYYFDMGNEALKETLQILTERRNRRNERLIKVLNEMGYHISLEDLRKHQPNNFIGKPVIARTLTAKGYLDDPKDAFKEGEFLGSKQARAIRKEKLHTEEAIELINEAGGIAVLAHPIQTRGIGEIDSLEFYMNIDTIIGRLKKQGLKGLECYHPDQNDGQTLKFIELAEKYHLHITRGSDFHGKNFIKAEVTVDI
ncbi:MAG: PHP domain-containing protein [Clostridiales bacterium]|nr:PHP domain-containing protein [Clostridiales bacterium]